MMRSIALLLVAAACSSGSTTTPPPNFVCNGNADLCACSIDVSVNQNTTGCSPADVGGAGALCCASSGYPGSGSCACTAPVRCYAETGGKCYCDNTQHSPSDTPTDVCSPPAGGGCCLDPSGPTRACVCAATTTCSTSGTNPSSCTAAATVQTCDTTQHSVDKCR